MTTKGTKYPNDAPPLTPSIEHSKGILKESDYIVEGKCFRVTASSNPKSKETLCNLIKRMIRNEICK